MIAKVKRKRKNRLSKTTIMAFRNLARKGSDEDLENFLYEVAMHYIADVRDADFVDEENYIYIKDTTFECMCPNCSTVLELDLKDLTQDDDKRLAL